MSESGARILHQRTCCQSSARPVHRTSTATPQQSTAAVGSEIWLAVSCAPSQTNPLHMAGSDNSTTATAVSPSTATSPSSTSTSAAAGAAADMLADVLPPLNPFVEEIDINEIEHIQVSRHERVCVCVRAYEKQVQFRLRLCGRPREHYCYVNTTTHDTRNTALIEVMLGGRLSARARSAPCTRRSGATSTWRSSTLTWRRSGTPSSWR